MVVYKYLFGYGIHQRTNPGVGRYDSCTIVLLAEEGDRCAMCEERETRVNKSIHVLILAIVVFASELGNYLRNITKMPGEREPGVDERMLR